MDQLGREAEAVQRYTTALKKYNDLQPKAKKTILGLGEEDFDNIVAFWLR